MANSRDMGTEAVVRHANVAGSDFLDAMRAEFREAREKHAPINRDRSLTSMYLELVQIATMAMRTATDVVEPAMRA